MNALPAQAFFRTIEQRGALARQRFFDEGVRPTGLVPEAVIQSWTRCRMQRRETAEPIAPKPLSALRVQSALRRARPLLAAAAPDLPHLQALARSAGCQALILDGDGITVHAGPPPEDTGERLLPRIAGVGYDVSEPAFGTTAPGIALHSGQPCVVQGAEHYFDGLQALRCAAAPIRDGGGRVAGVLNLTTEGRPFGFDAAIVASAYAAAIEQRLLRAAAAGGALIRLQIHPDWVDTPLAALVGIAADGRIAWRNEAARRLLPPEVDTVAALFGRTLAELGGGDGITPTALPGGLIVWWRAETPGADARLPAPPSAPPAVPAAPPEAPLAQQQRAAVERALKACGGNVSRAARMLKVSRGYVYRHLQGGALFHA